MNKLKLLIPPPVVALIALSIVWIMDRIFPCLRFRISGFGIISAVLIFLGVVSGLTGILSFRKRKTTINPSTPDNTTFLVTRGIYRFTRNPMYLGLLSGIAGVWFYLGNPASVLGILFFILYINMFQIEPEEKILSEKFGKDFENYRRHTRRWL